MSLFSFSTVYACGLYFKVHNLCTQPYCLSVKCEKKKFLYFAQYSGYHKYLWRFITINNPTINSQILISSVYNKFFKDINIYVT